MEFAAPKRGQTVVDFCAGAGGKTLALAGAMRSSGQIYARLLPNIVMSLKGIKN